MSKRDFEKLLLEAVDDGLSSLGETSKEAIYFHLEKSFKIKKEEIPRKIKNFTRAIEKIFGLGANFLEILIMRRLYEKIGGSFECCDSMDFAFVEYASVAKRSFLERKGVEMIGEFIECKEIGVEA